MSFQTLCLGLGTEGCSERSGGVSKVDKSLLDKAIEREEVPNNGDLSTGIDLEEISKERRELNREVVYFELALLGFEVRVDESSYENSTKMAVHVAEESSESEEEIMGFSSARARVIRENLGIIFPDGGKVMMEYIGATGVPVSFDAVPVDDDIDFNFILSFAIDANSTGEYQNGVFSPYWSSDLTPESVSAIKQRHPNMKVLASLSGWSLGDKVLHWYNPPDPSSWINNAFTSLQSIVTAYHLDGIDVDYENFPKHNSFAFCMGELLTRLKNEGVITVASIAPYYKTVAHYVELYSHYNSTIDYVNHQFYTDKVRKPKGYAEAFKVRAGQFDAKKLLPSYEVDGRGIQGDVFFDALGLIEENGFEVNGVMIWSADGSASNGYYYEKKSQEFLLNSTKSK